MSRPAHRRPTALAVEARTDQRVLGVEVWARRTLLALAIGGAPGAPHRLGDPE